MPKYREGAEGYQPGCHDLPPCKERLVLIFVWFDQNLFGLTEKKPQNPNKSTLSTTSSTNSLDMCSCPKNNKELCPLSNKCTNGPVVYQATVTIKVTSYDERAF